MSQFFKERHHNFVMNHFEKGTENALNRIKRLYGCHKEGHIFPIFLYVSIYPNIEKGLSYMGIIRPRKVYNNYILVKHDGTVDSYSPEIAEYLSLDTRKKYNITEICPDFEKINNAFNYVTKRKYTNLYDEELPDYKADSLARRSNDYQLKVTNAIESQKKLAEGADEIPKTVSGSQPLLNSMNTDHYEPSASATASGDQEHKRLASLDTKDYASVSKPTKGSKEGAKTMGKGGARSQVHKKFRRLNTEDIEEYQKIYDQMSVNGSVLNFTTNGNKAETATRSYLCTVADEIFDYSILRIITLGRNDETINGEKDADMQLKNPNRAITEAKAFSPIMKPKSNPGSGKKPKNNNISVQEREISILDMTADKGISDMPHQDGFQVFKNPFSPEESEHQEEPADKLKETIHNLLATNPEPAESQLMFSSRKDLPSELRDNHSSKAGYIHNKSNSSGNNLEQFDDKYHDSKDFIQELMLNADGKMNKVEVSSMSSGSLRGGGSVVSKLESLLYKKTRGRSSNKFKIYYGIIAVCIILAIVDVAVSSNFLETGSERVQMMLYVGGRINYLLNLYYQTVNLNLSLKGLMDTNRHLDTLGIADFPQYMFNAMRPAAEVLLDANARVMNDIGNLQESSKARFYKNTVAIQYPSAASSTENVASLNSFLAVDTLARSALEIASVAFPDLSTMQENIDYILLNSVNDLYLEMRNSYKIYEEDLDDNSSKGRLIAWGMAIAAISIYILFCALLVRDMTSTYKDKIRFWNSLVKLETEKSISHKKMLHVIKDNLEGSSNYSLLKRALIDTKKQEAKTVKTSKDKSTQGGGFKRLKTYKFQNRNYFIILPFMIIFVLILVFFILSAVFVGVEASNKKVYMDEIRNAETYYQLNVITANGVYQYIDQGSSSKIESVPVLDSVNTNLARLAKLGHFVNSFENKNGFSPRAYLQQDYCLTFTTPAEISQCRTIGNGLNVHGLVGILTYSKDALMRVMDVIRSSAQTVSDKKDALDQDSLITMEAEYMYLTGGFENLFKLLLQGEKDSQDSFQSNQIVFIVVFVVLLVVLNYIMVLAGFKRLDGQKFDNMKILRVIPVSMILESKMLKTYLLKSFKDDLSSVKNKM